MPQTITSFETIKQIDIKLEFDTNTCEKFRVAEIDGQKYLITIRNKNSQDKSIAEIAMYDLDLNLKASYIWSGDAMDFQVAKINGYTRIIVSGRETNPVVKIFDINLNPIANVSWELQANSYCTAKCLFVSDDSDIIVLSIVEGSGSSEGYIQIRIYDRDLQLKKITRWTYPNGKVVKWGHCLISIDIDNDGKDELIALINFERNGSKRSELRILDDNLAIKKSSLITESIFATCMVAGDVDNDGKNEIVIGGGAFSGRWQGATNQITVLDRELNEKIKTSWKTFRHSWLWDMQIADVDNDGKKEIITYGGTSMTGKNQNEANTIGEISIHKGKTLDIKDIFLWQTESFNDTRPSRGVIFQNDNSLCFAITTSKWMDGQRTNKLELRLFEYKPNLLALKKWTEFINACNEKDSKELVNYANPNDVIFAPIALEALALCGDDRSIELIGNYLATQDKPLFVRASHLLQSFGKRSVEQLRRAGFAIHNDWLIASPFDNTDNKGFDKVYPPEIETDFSAFYAGKGRIVRWGKTAENVWDDRRYNIYADLNYIYFDGFERTGIEHGWNILNLKSIGYALTYVESPETMEAEIRIGIANGAKIWVNGDLIYKNDSDKSPEIDQYAVPILLQKGKNKIMLKVAGKNENGWGFFFRIVAEGGKQINGLEYRQPDVEFFHNEMLTHRQLARLIKSDDEWLRYYAGVELMSIGDKRGKETIESLLKANDECVRANSALALTSEGYDQGVETLIELAPAQDPLFQFSAGNALERIGDTRSERFSIYNVKDENGKAL
ncbi:TPA: hypothetical protein ENS27_00125, partial [bacterium]|nr:hypothetical protein [bacterium]